MKKAILASLLASAAALSGCVTGTPVNFESARSLKPGMTETQVTEIMGSPRSTYDDEMKRHYLKWGHSDLMTGAYSNLVLVFQDGKLVAVPGLPGDPPPPDPDEGLPHIMIYATALSSTTQEFPTKTLCQKVLGKLRTDAFLNNTSVITGECMKK